MTFCKVWKESNFSNMSKNHEFSSHEKNKLGKLDINLMQETVSSEKHRNLKYYFPLNSICNFPICCQNFPIFKYSEYAPLRVISTVLTTIHETRKEIYKISKN